ncbi:MAG TPA: sugar phosphate nucleotidyltransferase [Syntrophomonadaceae bacterium]|nr:sugar phosphate nucleotidyltransferase [Syntrophomonadaceae bacterium]HPU49463.1 sugar phosphate nucleotidyltransferase [Syntrophomonadaceae bacterium]HQD91265.1 sugar phosphate nucleotidyltransferase [Syntrophomonadaceae bacterium]
MKAVLLAAGEGKRLRPFFSRPKPLVPLLGLALIQRNILALRDCGIKEFIIITGYQAEEIEEYLGTGEKLGVQISYLHNAEWQLGNGVSAYTLRQNHFADEKYILMMADHVFEIDVIKSFLTAAQTLEAGEVLLAADRRLEQVYDLDECTKVKGQDDFALRLGKDLQDYNAVDCGLFIGSQALLDALGKAVSQGRYTLTDGVNLLAESRKVRLFFLEGNWVDVDDLESYKYAEKMLLKSLVPPKDGLISRTFNRPLSLRITKVLAKTAVTPNQITWCSFFVAVLSAICFAVVNPILAGLLTQFASILDGVDGEIARLKFMRSNYGGLLDAILDRYGDFLIIIGMTYAWYTAAADPLALGIGAAALTGIPLSMLFKEKFHALTGKPYIPEIHDGITRYLPANRDGRLFIIFLGGIFNLLPLALAVLAIITHLQAWWRLYNARRII